MPVGAVWAAAGGQLVAGWLPSQATMPSSLILVPAVTDTHMVQAVSQQGTTICPPNPHAVCGWPDYARVKQ